MRRVVINHGPARPVVPALTEQRGRDGWVLWKEASGTASDPDKHEHVYRGEPYSPHRHRGGSQPHDHLPSMP